jgi:hypothetical protein
MGHEQAQCSLCHFTSAAASSDKLVAVTDDGACRSCHSTIQTGAFTRLGFHGQPGRQCSDCHTFHESKKMLTAMGEGELPPRNVNSEGHCAACHSIEGDLDDVSPGHRVAAQLYHSGEIDLEMLTPSEACLVCHSSGGSTLPSDLMLAEAPQFNEHASHAYGISLQPGWTDPRLRIRNVLDVRIQLFDQQIECATCHNLGAREEDLLVEFDTPYGLCQGCHEHGDSDEPAEMLAMRK